MRSLFIGLSLLFIPALSAHAKTNIIKSSEAFGLYHIDSDKNTPIILSLTKELETNDMCNSFNLGGDIKRVKDSSMYVADFHIMSTKMYCPSTGTRKITLKSRAFTVGLASDAGRFSILVPEGFTVELHK